MGDLRSICGWKNMERVYILSSDMESSKGLKRPRVSRAIESESPPAGYARMLYRHVHQKQIFRNSNVLVRLFLARAFILECRKPAQKFDALI